MIMKKNLKNIFWTNQKTFKETENLQGFKNLEGLETGKQKNLEGLNWEEIECKI